MDSRCQIGDSRGCLSFATSFPRAGTGALPAHGKCAGWSAVEQGVNMITSSPSFTDVPCGPPGNKSYLPACPQEFSQSGSRCLYKNTYPVAYSLYSNHKGVGTTIACINSPGEDNACQMNPDIGPLMYNAATYTELKDFVDQHCDVTNEGGYVSLSNCKK